MGAGRKSLPTRLKQLRGNPGKRALNKADLAITPLDAVPRPPAGLDRYAAQKWKSVCGKMLSARYLTELDLDLIANLCRCYSQIRHCDKEIVKRGHLVESATKNGIMVVANPAVNMRLRAIQVARLIEAELCITTGTRAKNQPAVEPPKDPLAELAARRAKLHVIGPKADG